MQSAAAPLRLPGEDRVAWVDYAKGICIILVVMFHTVNHYEVAVGAQGWMRWIVEFSKPFRMPDFFLISGLFLSRTIDAPLRDFLDKKVVHFAYFYLLWLGLTLLVTDHDMLRANPVEFLKLYGWNILQPTGVLWFVHMLAVFYVATRLLRHAPKWAVLLAAAALQVSHQALLVDTPSFIANRFMDYFVFFFLGYAIHGVVFSLADRTKAKPLFTLGVLAAWAVGNFWLTQQGLHHLPLYGLLTALAGAIAVVEIAALLSKWKSARFFRYCGQNSIVIYLTFFFPMTALERLLAKTQIIPDVGWASFAILLISVLVPLGFHLAIRKTPLIALYVRPKWAKLTNNRPGKLVEAVA
ncbi:MAG: acyltransferase family protein [Hyphomonadaceae bacterium]|nr:acyltransferase family protein [Hyphomonadaceae bacterium]